MTRYVLSPFYPVSDKLDVSHRAGWARYWAKELGAELLTTKTMDKVADAKKGDTLFLYHGMEWRGAMNLQSGLTDEIALRADRLIKCKADVTSLDIPMPGYGALLEARGYAHGGKLDNRLRSKSYLPVPATDTTQIIMGDSHSLSQYRPGAVIYRADGQTLHGALQIGLLKRLEEWLFETDVLVNKKTQILTVYFGNIDIRHHLARQVEPWAAVKELVAEYAKQLLEIQRTYKKMAINIVCPLPIEHEDRTIPKTGWYKGTPFFGTWQERTELSKLMRKEIDKVAKKHTFGVSYHPKHFTNKQGELSYDVMEQPRSVHIRPSEYRLVQEGLSW